MSNLPGADNIFEKTLDNRRLPKICMSISPFKFETGFFTDPVSPEGSLDIFENAPVGVFRTFPWGRIKV